MNNKKSVKLEHNYKRDDRNYKHDCPFILEIREKEKAEEISRFNYDNHTVVNSSFWSISTPPKVRVVFICATKFIGTSLKSLVTGTEPVKYPGQSSVLILHTSNCHTIWSVCVINERCTTTLVYDIHIHLRSFSKLQQSVILGDTHHTCNSNSARIFLKKKLG